MAVAGAVLGGTGFGAPAGFRTVVGVIPHGERLAPVEHIGDGQIPGTAVAAGVTEATLLDALFMQAFDGLAGISGGTPGQGEEFRVANDLVREPGDDLQGDQQA